MLGCAGVKDYLVDALALHDHMHLLHEVLADPGTLKVRTGLPSLLYLCPLFRAKGKHVIKYASVLASGLSQAHAESLGRVATMPMAAGGGCLIRCCMAGTMTRCGCSVTSTSTLSMCLTPRRLARCFHLAACAAMWQAGDGVNPCSTSACGQHRQ